MYEVGGTAAHQIGARADRSTSLPQGAGQIRLGNLFGLSCTGYFLRSSMQASGKRQLKSFYMHVYHRQY